jgi:hypothetical protein
MTETPSSHSTSKRRVRRAAWGWGAGRLARRTVQGCSVRRPEELRRALLEKLVDE